MTEIVLDDRVIEHASKIYQKIKNHYITVGMNVRQWVADAEKEKKKSQAIDYTFADFLFDEYIEPVEELYERWDEIRNDDRIPF